MPPEYQLMPGRIVAAPDPTPPQFLPVPPAQAMATLNHDDQQVPPTKPKNFKPIDLQKPLKRKWADFGELQNIQPPVFTPRSITSGGDHSQMRELQNVQPQLSGIHNSFSEVAHPYTARMQNPEPRRNPFFGNGSVSLETLQQHRHRLSPHASPTTVPHRDVVASLNQAAFVPVPALQASTFQPPAFQAPVEQYLVEQAPVKQSSVEKELLNAQKPEAAAPRTPIPRIKLITRPVAGQEVRQTSGLDEISGTQTSSPEPEPQIVTRTEKTRKWRRIIDPYPPLQSSLASEHVKDSFNATFSSYDKEHSAKNFEAYVERGVRKLLAAAPWYDDAPNSYKSRNSSRSSSHTSSPQVLSPVSGPTLLPHTSITPITLDNGIIPGSSMSKTLIRPGQGARHDTLQRRFFLLERTYACKIRSWLIHVINDLQKGSSTRVYDYFRHQLAFTPTGEVEHWTYVADANPMWREQCIVRLHEISYTLLQRIRAEHEDELEWEGKKEEVDSVDPTWRFRAHRSAWQDMAKFWKLLHAKQGAPVKKLWLPIVQIHYGLEDEDMKDPLAFGTPK